MEIFTIIFIFSSLSFFVFGMLALFSWLLTIVFEDYLFGDICDTLTGFFAAMIVISGVVAIISGFITLFIYISSHSIGGD